MTDRTVKVTLTAVTSSYLQGMDQASRKTRETGSEVEKLAQKRQAFETIGRSALVFGLAVAAAVGAAIVKTAEFDQAMSQTNAILQESAENQRLLRDAALDAGGATVFTATEAANAEEELGKAGLSTAYILGGALSGSLSLAAAGQLDVARSAEITGITLKQFGLDGTQAARVADVLAAGANKAVGGVEDLAQGLKFVGPVADSMNVSLEDTVATLALFADRGVLGEQAGTSLRGVLASLTSPSKQAQKALADLGVTLYDGQGRFLGLENTAGQLNKALAGASDAERDMALGVIFGNQQITAARILVGAGAAGWQEYRDAVEDSGIAQRVAAERMDNLAGDVEKLGGALDTALIQSGSVATEVLRGLTQQVTGAIDGFSELPEWVQGSTLVLGALTAAVALSGGVFLTAVPKIAAYRAALDDLGPGAQRFGRILQGVTRYVGVFAAALVVGEVAGGLDAWGKSASGASKSADQFRLSLKEGATALETVNSLAKTGELGDLFGGNGTRAIQDLTGGFSGLAGVMADVQDIDWLSGLLNVSSFGTIDSSLSVTRDNLRELDTALTDLYGSGKQDQAAEVWAELVKQTDGSAESIQKLKDLFPQYSEAQLGAADSTGEASDALAVLEGRADSAGSEIDDLADRIRGFGSAQFDLREANRQVEESLDDLREKLAENGRTFDISTEAGRENQAALDDLAQSYLDQAAAVGIQQGSLESAIPVLDRGREAFIEAAEAAGYGTDEAGALADQLGLLPENVKVLIDANTSAAKKEIDDLVRNPRKVYIDAVLRGVGGLRSDVNFQGGIYDRGVRAFASGGFPSGIYAGVQGGIHKFAESEMGVPWETYISGRAQDRARNIGIWQETGNRLGVWRSAPQHMVAPSAAPAPAERLVKIEVNNVGVDPVTASEILTQRLATKLVTLG